MRYINYEVWWLHFDIGKVYKKDKSFEKDQTDYQNSKFTD